MSHSNVDDAQIDPNTGLPLYGMDKELYAKAQAKWSEGGGDRMQEEAKEWIEACLQIKLEDPLQAALKSGVVLCNLVNAIKPGCCAKPSGMAAPFKQMENVGNYLKACTSIGCKEVDAFQTVSLYENKDMFAVLRQIHQLGAQAQTINQDLPPLGVKLADANARTFTDAQKAEAAAQPTLLGKGSHGHASQAGTFDTSKQIVKTQDQAIPTAEIGQMSMGSVGLARNDGIDTSKEIVRNQGGNA